MYLVETNPMGRDFQAWRKETSEKKWKTYYGTSMVNTWAASAMLYNPPVPS